MTTPIRHGRNRDRSNWWPLIPGVLIGMTIGVVVFANVGAVIR